MADKAQVKKNIVTGFLLLIGIALCAPSVRYLWQGLQAYQNKHDWAIIFLFIVCIVIVGGYFFVSKICTDKKSEVLGLMIIIAMGIALRMLVMHLMQTEPISDFATPHAFYQFYNEHGPYTTWVPWEKMDFYQLYYASYPAWFPYMRLIMCIYDWFGCSFQLVLKMNLILSGATIIFIYLAAKKLFSSRAAMMSALLWAVCPSLIIYTGITTPDHITMLFVAIAVWCFAVLESKRECAWREKIPWMVVTTVMMAAVNWFKPLSILFLLAFVCAYVLFIAFPLRWESIKSKTKAYIKYITVFIAMFLVVNTLSSALLTHWVESFMKVEVVDSTGMYLLWGWSVGENGEYDSNVATQILSELKKEYKNDLPRVMQEINQLTRETIASNWKLFVPIISSKAELMLSEYGYWGFSNTSTEEGRKDAIELIISTPYRVSCDMFMRVMYIFLFIAIVRNILFNKHSAPMNFLFFVLLGYTMILLLGGVQGRYKCIVMPVLCIVCSVGIETIVQMASKIYITHVRGAKNEQIS